MGKARRAQGQQRARETYYEKCKLFSKRQSINQQGHVLSLKKVFTQGPIHNSNYNNLIDGQVRFEPVLTGSGKLSYCLNLRLDRRFGPALPLNLGPDLGPVLQSSGSNFGSGPNHGITTRWDRVLSRWTSGTGQPRTGCIATGLI